MKPTVSIIMTLFVLFASVGVAKTTHFCMGHEMESEIGFGKKHLDCGMNMHMDHSENEDDNQQDPNSCCENITTQLQVDDEFHLKKVDHQFSSTFALALVQVFVFGIDPIQSEKTKVPPYFTPPLEEDFQILYQRFLI